MSANATVSSHNLVAPQLPVTVPCCGDLCHQTSSKKFSNTWRRADQTTLVIEKAHAPGTYPVIRFLTLAGFDGPAFETNQEFNRLGTSYRVHWHCGAGPVDFRGAWKNEGSAT